MDRNKIFSKLNMKNYHDELEEVLEKKLFSLDVKNLLLSMLYKLENAYKDYVIVKVEVLPYKEYISYIVKIIKEYCFDIQFINKKDEIKIDKEKGKIYCLPNEKSLLSAIWYMGQEEAKVETKYFYTNNAVQRMIEVGSNCNQTEILRDFNGWSWDIVTKEIENLQYNILYQSLLLLNGKDLIYNNIDREKSKEISINTKNKNYDDFFEAITNCSLSIYKQEKAEIFEEIEKIKQEKVKELETLNNKKEFLQNITNQKKECLAKIDKIDRIINNTELLKKEYQERNRLLPNKEKIFSISHLSDRLEEERQELLKQIQRCNKIIEPREFVKEKANMQNEVNFLTKEKKVIDCCKAFFRCVREEISKTQEKSNIINWIYKIRYYRYIPYDEHTYLKDIKQLEKDFKETIKLLTKKAQEFKIWDVFTENEELSYIVIKELLNSKMIDLNNVNMECKYENGILYIEYYDGDILETKLEFKVENVRIKKKIKLFL